MQRLKKKTLSAIGCVVSTFRYAEEFSHTHSSIIVPLMIGYWLGITLYLANKAYFLAAGRHFFW